MGLIARRIPRGDLKLDHDTKRFVTLSGAPYARQRIEVTLDFFLGEWFLDRREGVSYFRDVLIKNPNSETVRSVFKRAIMNTPGIVAVRNLFNTVDKQTRRATVVFDAVYKDGTTIPAQKIEVIL
jgi:hypothetical protein